MVVGRGWRIADCLLECLQAVVEAGGSGGTAAQFAAARDAVTQKFLPVQRELAWLAECAQLRDPQDTALAQVGTCLSRWFAAAEAVAEPILAGTLPPDRGPYLPVPSDDDLDRMDQRLLRLRCLDRAQALETFDWGCMLAQIAQAGQGKGFDLKSLNAAVAAKVESRSGASSLPANSNVLVAMWEEMLRRIEAVDHAAQVAAEQAAYFREAKQPERDFPTFDRQFTEPIPSHFEQYLTEDEYRRYLASLSRLWALDEMIIEHNRIVALQERNAVDEEDVRKYFATFQIAGLFPDWDPTAPGEKPRVALLEAVERECDVLRTMMSGFCQRVATAADEFAEAMTTGRSSNGQSVPLATSPAGGGGDQYDPSQMVSLDQMAAWVVKDKSTLEGWKSRDRDFPTATIPGGGGKSSYWFWPDVVGYLREKSGILILPDRVSSLKQT